VSVTWTWGDGQSSSTSSFPASHTYASPGTYSISATAHQSDNRTASASSSVTITGAACNAPTISSPAVSVNGASVTVSGVATPGSGCSIVSVTWTWGDGQSSSTSSFPASHTYASVGTYSISATAHQSDGQTASASTSVKVALPSPCGAPTISLQAPSVGDLSVTANGVTAPGSANGLSSPGSGCTISSIAWSWGDGQSTTSFFPASHLYGRAGSYSLTATVHQSDGQTASASEPVTVSQRGPTLTYLLLSAASTDVTEVIGTSGSGVTATALDQNHNIMSGVTITISVVSGPGALSASSVTTGSGGQAPSFLTLRGPIVAGVLVTIQARSGTILSQPVTVAFVLPPQISPISGTELTQTFGNTNTISYENPNIGGGLADFSVKGSLSGLSAGGEITSFGAIAQDCQGHFQWNVYDQSFGCVAVGMQLSGGASDDVITMHFDFTPSGILSGLTCGEIHGGVTYLEGAGGQFTQGVTPTAVGTLCEIRLTTAVGIFTACTTCHIFDVFVGPSPSSGAASTTALFGGMATFDQKTTVGSIVMIKGSGAPDGTDVTLNSQNWGTTQPPGTGPLIPGVTSFFDFQVLGLTYATAQVCITDPRVTSSTVMQYWDDNQWIGAASQKVKGSTICGEIPVMKLQGTATDLRPAPTATLGGTAVTVSCARTSVSVGTAFTCKATVSGSEPRGNVTWSSSSAGKFSNMYCGLTSHGSVSACSVRFTPTAAVSSEVLTSAYGGDPENSPSAGTFLLAVQTKTTRMTVSCTPGSVSVFSSTANCAAKVSGYLPTGNVSWSQGGTGFVSFNSSTCGLTDVGSMLGTCSLTVTGTMVGKVTLQAGYLGDSNNQSRSGTAKLTVKNSG